MPLYKLLIYNIGADCLILVDGYCQYLTIQILQICTFYMNRKTAKAIAQSIKKLTYLENLERLQFICLQIGIKVDFDDIYFNRIESLSIASIYGISLSEDYLYILTKNKQLHSISISNREHSFIDLNKSIFEIKIELIYNKIKLLFNY